MSFFKGCAEGNHTFEGRFDISPAMLPANVAKVDGHNALEAFRRVTYVRDICTKCGKTVERSDK